MKEMLKTDFNSNTMRWYKSKVDWWIGILMAVPPIAVIAVFIGMIVSGDLSELLQVAVMAVFVCGIYFGLVFPMKYGIGGEELVIRFGICRFRIKLAEITEVRPTHNPLSAPALSIDRLYVQYGEGFFKAALISPADKEGFLNDLAQRTGLIRDGNSLRKSV